jgi:hypothetical protein
MPALTYLLPAQQEMELAPCTALVYQTVSDAGCQGFAGPYPSAFLDKLVLNYSASKKSL